MTEAPFDPGLQPERTLLAWRRTALAVAVGFVVAGRLAAPVLGAGAIPVAVAGLLAAAACYLLATQRYRTAHDDLTAGTGSLTHGAVPIALLAGGVGALGIGCLCYVVRLAV